MPQPSLQQPTNLAILLTEQCPLPRVQHVNPGPQRVVVILQPDPTETTGIVKSGFLFHGAHLSGEAAQHYSKGQAEDSPTQQHFDPSKQKVFNQKLIANGTSNGWYTFWGEVMLWCVSTTRVELLE